MNKFDPFSTSRLFEHLTGYNTILDLLSCLLLLKFNLVQSREYIYSLYQHLIRTAEPSECLPRLALILLTILQIGIIILPYFKGIETTQRNQLFQATIVAEPKIESWLVWLLYSCCTFLVNFYIHPSLPVSLCMCGTPKQTQYSRSSLTSKENTRRTTNYPIWIHILLIQPRPCLLSCQFWYTTGLNWT